MILQSRTDTHTHIYIHIYCIYIYIIHPHTYIHHTCAVKKYIAQAHIAYAVNLVAQSTEIRQSYRSCCWRGWSFCFAWLGRCHETNGCPEEMKGHWWFYRGNMLILTRGNDAFTREDDSTREHDQRQGFDYRRAFILFGKMRNEMNGAVFLFELWALKHRIHDIISTLICGFAWNWLRKLHFQKETAWNLRMGFGFPRWSAQKRKTAGMTRAQFTFQERADPAEPAGVTGNCWLNQFRFGVMKSLLIPQCLLVSGSTFAILAIEISQLLPISSFFSDTKLWLFYWNEPIAGGYWFHFGYMPEIQDSYGKSPFSIGKSSMKEQFCVAKKRVCSNFDHFDPSQDTAWPLRPPSLTK